MPMLCTKQGTILIVDPHPEDYQALTQSSSDRPRFRFLERGRDALRLSFLDPPELAVINAELPDMTGFDLFESLQPRLYGVPIIMTADRYRVEDEIKARVSGVTIFAYKPLHVDWLRKIRPMLWDF